MIVRIFNNVALCAVLAAGAHAYAADGHDHGKKTNTGKVAAKDAHDDHDDHGDAHDDHDDHSDHGQEVKLPEGAAKVAGIRVEKAKKRSLTASVVAPARVAFNADAMAHVGALIQGRVVEIKVRVGDVVKKDDVLVVVESTELGRSQSAYLQRRTEAEVAGAAVTPAKDAYDRAKKLFDESQGIAFAEVQKREVDYRAAVGTKATSESSMQAAENELHLLGITQEEVKKLVETREINPRYSIRAPIAGKVIEREVTLGELVAPEKEKILVLADTSSYWVWADIPEARLADIGVGSKADLTVAALPGVRMAGEVSLVSAEVDPNTRSARVRLVVENGNDKLKPGMFARVTLFAEGKEAVLAVPEEAIQTIEGKPSIFVPVEGEPNTFARRDVVLGKTVSGFMPVVSGLKEGESVVVSGTFILKAELGKSEAKHEH